MAAAGAMLTAIFSYAADRNGLGACLFRLRTTSLSLPFFNNLTLQSGPSYGNNL
jgi:hypothetical protein